VNEEGRRREEGRQKKHLGAGYRPPELKAGRGKSEEGRQKKRPGSGRRAPAQGIVRGRTGLKGERGTGRLPGLNEVEVEVSEER